MACGARLLLARDSACPAPLEVPTQEGYKEKEEGMAFSMEDESQILSMISVSYLLLEVDFQEN